MMERYLNNELLKLKFTEEKKILLVILDLGKQKEVNHYMNKVELLMFIYVMEFII